MIKTKDERIKDLCILGRDRLYIDLIECEKTIKFVTDSGFNSLKIMLCVKKEELEEKIKESTDLIDSLADNRLMQYDLSKGVKN